MKKETIKTGLLYLCLALPWVCVWVLMGQLHQSWENERALSRMIYKAVRTGQVTNLTNYPQ